MLTLVTFWPRDGGSLEHLKNLRPNQDLLLWGKNYHPRSHMWIDGGLGDVALSRKSKAVHQVKIIQDIDETRATKGGANMTVLKNICMGLAIPVPIKVNHQYAW